MQKTLHKIFYDTSSPAYVRVNDFLAFLTILSILGIVLETVDRLEQYRLVFLVIEYGTVFFFLLEYIGRIIAADVAWKYMTSFFGIIDLVAILPTLLGFGNFTFLKSARILRIVRFLRMVRLAKVARLKRHHDDQATHGLASFFTLTTQIYFMTLLSAITIGGSLMWFLEGYRSVFANIPLAMIWSAKVLLGGTPQAVPDTVFGEFVVIALRFTGLVLFGLLINIIGGGVKRLLFGTKVLLENATDAQS